MSLDSLQDKLDDIGYAQKEDWLTHTTLMFKWMQQATAELDAAWRQIRELKSRVRELEDIHGDSDE